MILVVLVFSAIALFLTFVYMHQNATRLILTTIFGIALVASLVLVIENDSQHLGMTKVTTTKTVPLKSAGSSQMDMLLYQSIGTADKNRVYIYKTMTDQKKVSTTKANVNTANHVKTTTGSTKLVTKTTRWMYQSNAAKFWFGIANNDNQLIKRTNTFYIQKTWVVLSTSQAKQLSKLAKQQSTTLKAQAKVYVQNAVKTAMVKNPAMTQAQMATLEKQAAAQYQAKAMQNMIKTVKQSK
ncbi:DUF4811 domain-containing protein [Lactiplantibacillus sp. WILCCON 0030]|uniref:DUF4811 domain-containing protein n=1 Tax=Lactiplantibacillus brownii TaxID=3069269 RepID=A0ABU1A7A4_9LACO|nr:DUF4811 domain-containing protein [Lactiplantibacillus brownii]MDQ7936809.1 DUF4811 domain-containing protein [Lactiplantibacillus brownii]